MTNEFYGDVVLFAGTSYSADLIHKLSKHPITHCALRTSEDYAESIEFGKERIIHNLAHPRPEYKAMYILRHKDITPRNRNQIYCLEEVVSREYDWKSIVKLALHYSGLDPLDPQEDISNLDDIFNCASRITHIKLTRVGLPTETNLHNSQWIPSTFLYEPRYEVTYQEMLG